MHEERLREVEQKYMEKQRRLKEIDTVSTLKTGAIHRTARQLDSDQVRQGDQDFQHVGTRRMVEEIPFQKTKPKKVKVNKEEQKKSYKDKFSQYIEKRREQELTQHDPTHKKPEKPKDFERFKCTSPNPVRSISPNKWDAGNIIENDKKLSKTQGEKKNKPVWGSEEMTATAGVETKKTEPKRVQSAKQILETQKFASSPKREEDLHEDDKISESEVRLLQWVYNLMHKVHYF